MIDELKDRGALGTAREAEEARDLESVVRERFAQLDQTERAVLVEVLRLEHEKLHLILPRGIKQDLADVIRRLVK